MVYNMRRWPKKKGSKNLEQKDLKTSHQKKNSGLLIKLLRSSYSDYADDDFYILFSQYFFQTTHDRYLLSKIRLVLFPTLYKFIVWAYWAKTQSYLGSKPKLVLTENFCEDFWSERRRFLFFSEDFCFCFFDLVVYHK